MDGVSTFNLTSRNTRLLAWCIAGSVAAHFTLLTVLPRWRAATETPPLPLMVALKPPPPIEPPKPLPLEAKPSPERPKAAEPVKPAPRDERLRNERPQEPPRQILTASPEAPVTPTAPVVQEQKPPPPPSETPRPQAVAPTPPPVPAPAPITQPRSDAAHLSNPAPVHPLASRRRGEQGAVLLRLIVTAEGLAKNVAVDKSSGFPALDEAAAAAVRNWRFVPARQGAQAIELPYLQPITFKLD